MNYLSATSLPSNRNMVFLFFALTAYAAASLLGQAEFPTWGDSAFSPIELALWLAIFVGVMGTIIKLSASDTTGVQHRYWTLATIAIVSISVLQSADWFADTQHIWQTAGAHRLNYFLEAALAIIFAAGVFWSIKLPKEQVWGARCLQATVVFQLLSILSELSGTGRFLGYSVPQFSFTTDFAELLCIEFYIVTLAVARVKNFSYGTAAAGYAGVVSPGSFVGANARQAYNDCKLYNSAKHPPIALAFYPGFQELTIFLVMFWLASTTGPIIRRATGKSITAQIKEMTRLWFHDGVDPPSYYALDLYTHNRFISAPHYLTRFETKNGLFYALNNQRLNPYPVSEMNNKVLFAECCAKFGIPYAQMLLTVSDGHIDWHCSETGLQTDIFCKRQRGMGAVGTHTYRYKHPNMYIDDAGHELDVNGLLEVLKKESGKHSLLVQPWLKNHPSIADLALDSLITIRVLTCLNEHGVPEVTLAMLRLLTKLEPQWAYVPDEEYAAPIDLQSGEMGLFTGDNMKTSHLRYENHLVTGSPIRGRVLHDWRGIRELAISAHNAFPHRMLVGWDIALTENGPVMLEGNTNLDVMFLQRVHDAPIGQSRFGELVNYHLKNLYGKQMAVWHG